MPLYEYECGTCSHRFELRRSFHEGANACCPRCKSTAQRVFAPVPIVFKGSGFYVTDYRKEKPPVEEKATSTCKTDCKPNKPGSCDASSCKTSKN